MRKASTINATIYANAGKLNAILNFSLSSTTNSIFLAEYGYVDFYLTYVKADAVNIMVCGRRCAHKLNQVYILDICIKDIFYFFNDKLIELLFDEILDLLITIVILLTKKRKKKSWRKHLTFVGKVLLTRLQTIIFLWNLHILVPVSIHSSCQDLSRNGCFN